MDLNQTKIITSVSNEKIKNYRKLLQKKYRDETNLFIVEGFHLVEEAQKARLIHEIITSDFQQKGTLVSEHVLKVLTTTKTPQNIVAICRKPAVKKLGKRVLALSDVQDPGNVGTLIRTCVAFNYDDVIISGVDVFNPKVIRASQGAIFKINILQTNDVSKYFKNFHVVGAVVDTLAKNYQEINPKQPFMIVLGNEGQGISHEIIDKIDEMVYIPIHFESLNVASAGAILLNQYKKINDDLVLFDL